MLRAPSGTHRANLKDREEKLRAMSKQLEAGRCVAANFSLSVLYAFEVLDCQVCCICRHGNAIRFVGGLEHHQAGNCISGEIIMWQKWSQLLWAISQQEKQDLTRWQLSTEHGMTASCVNLT